MEFGRDKIFNPKIIAKIEGHPNPDLRIALKQMQQDYLRKLVRDILNTTRVLENGYNSNGVPLSEVDSYFTWRNLKEKVGVRGQLKNFNLDN